MAKQSTRAEVNSFVKGFITEASPLNAPPNATLDEQNFELRRNGTRDRRLGIDLEGTNRFFVGGELFSQDVDEIPEVFVWKAPGGDSDMELLVVCTSFKVRIFDLTGEFVSNSELHSFTLSGIQKGATVSFCSVNGNLVTTYGDSFVHVLTFNPLSGTFSESYDSLKTRDIWGVTEEQESKKRPTSLTTLHEYNLCNQSWGVGKRNDAVSGKPYEYPVSTFFNTFSVFPSNVETLWTAMHFRPADPIVEAMVPNLWSDSLDVFTPAAKGYFVIDVLNRGSSRYQAYVSNPLSSPTPGLLLTINSTLAMFNSLANTDNTSGGATVVESYAGRAWFGGFNGIVSSPISTTPDLTSYVFFSQLVKHKQDVFKCYQEGDPTSREGSDIVDTDGGFIRISGLARLVGMRVVGDSLVVFGTNGVWEIKGDGDAGFSATNYSVRKITNFGCLSKNSIVTEGSAVFFWSDSGILTIGPDQFNVLQVTNLTQESIQTFYENISATSKQTAKGAYDALTRKVKWIYDIEADLTIAGVSRELILDLSLGAFSKNVFGVSDITSPRVVGIFNTPPFRSGQEIDAIVVNGDQVQVGGVDVQITSTARQSGVESIKYIVNYTDGSLELRGFALLHDQDFKDWATIRTGGIDAKAFMLTGAVTGGDSAIHKQVPYLVMHFRRTESGMAVVGGQLVPLHQSSCLIRSQWDWANSANSNKWSPLFQAYRQNRAYMPTGVSDLFDTGFETIVTKNKLRGRGRAFSLYMETEPGKDCRILGWNLSMNGNSVA